MKIILLFLSLAIFLPLSALATCTTDTPSNQLLRDVLDTDGNPLNTSSRYFIIPPHVTMEGGGTRLANLGDQAQNTCNTSVVRSPPVTDNGIAVYFGPKNPKYEKILVSSPVNIEFYFDHYLCASFAVWKVDNLLTQLPLHGLTISTGAKRGDPTDLSSWFQIEPLGSNYKLVFCPYGTCINIGIVRKNGYDRLVLSETPIVFNFKLHRGYGKAEAY